MPQWLYVLLFALCHTLYHCPQGNTAVIIYIYLIFILISRLNILSISCQFTSGDCNTTTLIISKHWFRTWPSVFKQQTMAVTYVEPDPWRHHCHQAPTELISHVSACILYIYLCIHAYIIWIPTHLVKVINLQIKSFIVFRITNGCIKLHK